MNNDGREMAEPRRAAQPHPSRLPPGTRTPRFHTKPSGACAMSVRAAVFQGDNDGNAVGPAEGSASLPSLSEQAEEPTTLVRFPSIYFELPQLEHDDDDEMEDDLLKPEYPDPEVSYTYILSPLESAYLLAEAVFG
ncbi:hypothetical protein PG984_011361 [Apiospora sp. TS-2023a]